MTTVAFDLKYHVLSWSGPVHVEHKLDRVDKKIGKKVKKIEYDYEHVRALRQENVQNVQKLNRAMARTEGRKLHGLQDTTMKEVRQYEGHLRRQVRDLVKIVKLLQKLVENEDYEIVFDIRQPMLIMENFFEQLRKGLKRVKLEKSSQKEFKELLHAINKDFDQLVDKSMEFINHDLSFFHNNYGLNFQQMTMRTKSDKSISGHLRKRGIIKQQLNGKTQWIASQLKRLEDSLKEIRKEKRKAKVRDDEADRLIQIVSTFRKEFSGLVGFAAERVDASSHMIIESVYLQREHVKQLKELEKEIDKFYDDILSMKGELMNSNENSTYHKVLAENHYDEMDGKQKSFWKEMKSFEKEVGRDLDDLLKKDTKGMRKEKKELRSIKRKILGFQKKIAKLMTVAAFAVFITSFSITPETSNVGIVRSTVTHTINNAESQTEIVKAIIDDDIESIQQQVNKITKKMENNEELTRGEISYVKSVYQVLVMGGLKMNLELSSKLLSFYLSGDGSTYVIEAHYYRDTKIVQYAMQEMMDYIKKGLADGTLESGGKITSRDVLPRNHKLDGGWEGDGQVEDGVLVPGKGTKEGTDLYYASHKFFLKAQFMVQEGHLIVNWSVDDVYDFELTEKVTNLPLPNSDKKIQLPHKMSNLLTKYDLAKEFPMHSSWTDSIIL